ncbi:hypothetical protein KC19_3G038200 [Ceratodon purpureus]|uniref:Uncharacterized protein n=1 Tax=Ceratodon purpureus TaxID=3225 RepID=A0A8T0IH62_CERPU|nr:hypothetical protein KC19_3G038200 [Ceratodon purpureus]
MMFPCSTNQKFEYPCQSSMASSDVVILRDSSSNTQPHILSPPYLCHGGLNGRVRMQESMCTKPAVPSSTLSALPLLGLGLGHGCGASSSPATPLDSPTQSEHSTEPPSTFSEQEDEILRELVKRHGTKKWHIISAKMQKKTPRECRKRWRTYLHMCMNKSSWSAEEDRLLLQGHNAFGNRWTEIAKMVPGRTDNAVKNRYNALCTKRSHPVAKASNGHLTAPGVKHHLVESWNDVNSHQYEHDVKRARRIAQDEEERFLQIHCPSHLSSII